MGPPNVVAYLKILLSFASEQAIGERAASPMQGREAIPAFDVHSW
jgi:hypothetical protein